MCSFVHIGLPPGQQASQRAQAVVSVYPREEGPLDPRPWSSQKHHEKLPSAPEFTQQAAQPPFQEQGYSRPTPVPVGLRAGSG